MLIDLWAHAHADDPKLADEFVDDDYEAELAAFEAASLAPDADFEDVVDETYGVS